MISQPPEPPDDPEGARWKPGVIARCNVCDEDFFDVHQVLRHLTDVHPRLALAVYDMLITQEMDLMMGDEGGPVSP